MHCNDRSVLHILMTRWDRFLPSSIAMELYAWQVIAACLLVIVEMSVADPLRLGRYGLVVGMVVWSDVQGYGLGMLWCDMLCVIFVWWCGVMWRVVVMRKIMWCCHVIEVMCNCIQLGEGFTKHIFSVFFIISFHPLGYEKYRRIFEIFLNPVLDYNDDLTFYV